jgi:hypothetical protein
MNDLLTILAVALASTTTAILAMSITMRIIESLEYRQTGFRIFSQNYKNFQQWTEKIDLIIVLAALALILSLIYLLI